MRITTKLCFDNLIRLTQPSTVNSIDVHGLGTESRTLPRRQG